MKISVCAFALVMSLTACGQLYSINPDSITDVGIDPTTEPDTEIVTKAPDTGTDTTTKGTDTTSGSGTPVASNDPTKSGTHDDGKSSTDPTKGTATTPTDGVAYGAPDTPDKVVSRSDKKHGKYCVIKDGNSEPMRCQKGSSGSMELPTGIAKVADARKPHKAVICHNYSKSGGAHRVTIAVGLPAVAAHLAHGDVAGACDDYKTKDEADMASSSADCKSMAGTKPTDSDKYTDKNTDKKSTAKVSDPTTDKKTADDGTSSTKLPPMYEKCEDDDDGGTEVASSSNY